MMNSWCCLAELTMHRSYMLFTFKHANMFILKFFLLGSGADSGLLTIDCPLMLYIPTVLKEFYIIWSSLFSGLDYWTGTLLD